VWVLGTGLAAITDRRGRFRIDSVPVGPRVLVMSHPALDSAGMSDVPARVRVTAGRMTDVTIAVPSFRTLAAAACGGSAASLGGDSGGVVFGAVRDAESGRRLSGASVSVSWGAIDRAAGPLAFARRTREVLTDSLGNYYLCGVAKSTGLLVRAGAGPFTSGELQMEVGERGLLRHDLSVSRELPEEAGDSVADQGAGLATLVGSVRSAGGQPLEMAVVSVPGVSSDALTDSAGRFVLTGLPSGSRMLYVRRIGYWQSATAVELRNRDTTRVSVQLATITVLDTLRVTATQWVRAEIDELERRLSAGNRSRVLTMEDLRPIGTVGAALQNFAMLEVRNQVGGLEMYYRRRLRLCRPEVWIDGWLASADMLEHYRPADLIALEAYPPLDVPLRYQRRESCGVVLAWTRNLQ